MSNGINKVILVGRLGKDPETRFTASGTAITNISVATEEVWKDKDGNKKERVEYHRVKFFGRLAEIAAEYLKKGRQVYVEGSLRTEKYTGKDGVERYSTDIVANEMQILGSRDTEQEDGTPRTTRGVPGRVAPTRQSRESGPPLPRSAPAETGGGIDDFDDASIPF